MSAWFRRGKADGRSRRELLEAFADDNGLIFVEKAGAPPRAGLFFSQGAAGYDEQRTIANVLRLPDGSLEAGEYHFIAPGYRGAISPDGGEYAIIRLARPVPPMLLHDNANVGRGPGFDARTPTKFKAMNGARFTLFAWPRHADDARAIVDQELIELLAGHKVELEFLDDTCVLYRHASIQIAEPRTWHWLVDVAHVLQARTGRTTFEE